MKILKNENAKKVYLVATPIGNLADMTFRSVQTLQECDVIYAEDTKVSSHLLKHFEIKVPLRSLHKYNENSKAEEIITFVNEGKKIAIISDAGTPLINDPGTFLAKHLIANDIMLYPIIGASCVSATLSINSFNSQEITYLGFVDKRSKDKIKYILKGELDVLCLISPHFIVKLIEIVNQDACRDLIIAKEITKRHETHMYLSSQEFLDNHDAFNLKGEFTIIIAKKTQNSDPVDIQQEIIKLLAEKKSNKDIIQIIKQNYKMKKNEIYDLIMSNKEK